MIIKFINNGRLTVLGEVVLIILVLLGFIGIPLLGMPIWVAIPIGALAVFSAAILIFEGAAVSIGLKPFTNDPLGWRKAKQSYKQEPNETSEPAQPQDDQALKRDEP